MEDKIVHKIIAKVKDKLSNNKTNYPSVDEYAFSTEELENISEQNKQKIQELKQDIFPKRKKEFTKKLIIEDVISSIEEKQIKEEKVEEEIIKQQEEISVEEIIDKEIEKEEKEEDNTIEEIIEKEEKEEDNTIEEIIENEEIEETNKQEPVIEEQKNSFINLQPEYQKIVMNKWNEINLTQIDKDIMEAKDLLNHNYTITYADDAARFIHDIRKKYEIVICYLIGFNNEKKGIYEKTIFSDSIDNEWKTLSNYIKILEKIRNFKR